MKHGCEVYDFHGGTADKKWYMAEHYTVWQTTSNISKELLAYILHPEYQNFLPDYMMSHHLKIATFYHSARAITGKLN